MSAVPSRAMLDIWYARVGRARPFLRWAGGKGQFLFRYSDRFPAFNGTYFEPFLGSGSVFFHFARNSANPPRAVLGDTNRHLIATFVAVRDSADEVSDRLGLLQRRYLEA